MLLLSWLQVAFNFLKKLNEIWNIYVLFDYFHIIKDIWDQQYYPHLIDEENKVY